MSFCIFNSPKKWTKKKSTLLLWYLKLNCFCSFFWDNWRHQKGISKITDLYMWCSAFSLAICYYSIRPQRSCRSKPWSPGVKLCPRFGNRFMGTPSKSPPLEFFSVQIRIPKPAIYETIQSQPLAAGWHHLIVETT